VVYAAFSDGVTEHIFSTVTPWRLAASGLPMALALFDTASVGLIMLPLMLFHMIQLLVCAVIAGRLSRVPAQDEDVRRPP
jgi:predicted Na+-dependent transporter